MTVQQVRENRLRRMAERQGLRLVKSKRRDHRATGYGTFAIVDAETGTTKLGPGLSVDEVETALDAGDL